MMMICKDWYAGEAQVRGEPGVAVEKSGRAWDGAGKDFSVFQPPARWSVPQPGFSNDGQAPGVACVAKGGGKEKGEMNKE